MLGFCFGVLHGEAFDLSVSIYILYVCARANVYVCVSLTYALLFALTAFQHGFQFVCVCMHC